jgi:F-type H+-transporting ATPase subunit delta
MPSRASATRYARALFDVALKESDPVQIGRDLASFADLMSSNAELHGALTNPAVPAAAKRQIASTLATRLSIAAPAHKLLLLLADRDRLAVVPDLLSIYRERLMEHQQVVRRCDDRRAVDG